MKKILICLLVIMLLLCSCAKPAEEVTAEPTPIPTYQPTPEPTPEPTPQPTDISHAEELFLLAWESTVISQELIPEEMLSYEKSPILLFMEDYEERLWLLELQASAAEDLNNAVEYAASAVAEHYGLEYTLTDDVTPLSWQYLYLLIHFGMENSDLSAAVRTAMELQLTFENVNEHLNINVTAAPRDYQETIKTLLPDKNDQLSAEFLYSYIYTAYTDTAEMAEYAEREPDGNLSTIVWPLESHIRLRKTWYADRDNGTRRHMGTDIWAKEDTELYSCTDGTVTYVGYGKGSGYAVIVEDEYGYEYHYYHMVRQTDFLKEGDTVKAGDLVGHVGNTGNSSRDHLHLTIIAPDGYYINPYPYLEPIEP